MIPLSLLVAVGLAAAPVPPGDKARNPFGLPDVTDPVGDDVRAFAADVKLTGGNFDDNAEQWVKDATPGKAGSLDGEWAERYGGVKGTAKVRVIGDRVYILATDDESGARWMVEAEKDKAGRLVGRWVQAGQKDGGGPFVGQVVDDERIDGAWGDGTNRWDFRRKLKK